MPKKRKSAPKQTSVKFLVVLVGLLILSIALLITIKQKQSTSPLSLNQLTSATPPPIAPSPVPMPTSAPTPRPTPSPTPQPPVANQAPIIKTGILPTGIANIQYSATIAAYDSDSGTSQSITITASGLPTGLSLKSCFNRYSGSTLTTSCTISGKPIRAGSYQVTLKATDWQGASSTKTLPLNIVKSNSRIIPIDPRPTPVAQ